MMCVSTYLPTYVGFSLLHSAIQCIRGARSINYYNTHIRFYENSSGCGRAPGVKRAWLQTTVVVTNKGLGFKPTGVVTEKGVVNYEQSFLKRCG